MTFCSAVPCGSAAPTLRPGTRGQHRLEKAQPLLALPHRCCIPPSGHRAGPEEHFEISKQCRNYYVKEAFLTHQQPDSAFRNAAGSKLLLKHPPYRANLSHSLPAQPLCTPFLPSSAIPTQGSPCHKRGKSAVRRTMLAVRDTRE